MRILITGATGSLGQRTVAAALAQGHDVAIVTRRPFLAQQLFGDSVTHHEWHPVHEAFPVAALEGGQGIIHLAGEALAGRPYRHRSRLVEASRRIMIERLGEAIAGRPLAIVAVSMLRPPTGALETSADRLDADLIALGRHGARVAVVQLGLVAGDGPVIEALVALARAGLVPDLRGAIVPAIDADDAAAMMIGLLGMPDQDGLIAAAAPVPVSGEALADLLRGACRTGLRIPVPMALAARYLGPAAPLFAGRTPVVPTRLIAAGARFAAPDPMASLASAIKSRVAS
jgi:NAD dependent epimerase/dehydratase family enzyme